MKESRQNIDSEDVTVRIVQSDNSVVASRVESIILPSSTNNALIDLIRVLFSFLASMALIWVAMHFFWDFESFPPDQREKVVAANAWMLIPVGILLAPVLLLSNVFSTSLMVIREVINPEQIGSISILILLSCIGLIILWLVAADSYSKKIFADAIKTMLGATVGAALEHRATTASQANPKREKSRSLPKQ